jgi:hypothetical protein
MHYQKTNYFEEYSLYAFDCILLLRVVRFTQFDVEICLQASKYNIPIALGLGKVDQDVASCKRIRVRELHRPLQENEYRDVIRHIIENLKLNAKVELTSIRGSEGQNLNKIPMFAIAS